MAPEASADDDAGLHDLCVGSPTRRGRSCVDDVGQIYTAHWLFLSTEFRSISVHHCSAINGTIAGDGINGQNRNCSESSPNNLHVPNLLCLCVSG